jgi:hypothetical protein
VIAEFRQGCLAYDVAGVEPSVKFTVGEDVVEFVGGRARLEVCAQLVWMELAHGVVPAGGGSACEELGAGASAALGPGRVDGVEEHGVVPVTADDERVTVDPRRKGGHHEVVVPCSSEGLSSDPLVVCVGDRRAVNFAGDGVDTGDGDLAGSDRHPGRGNVARQVRERGSPNNMSPAGSQRRRLARSILAGPVFLSVPVSSSLMKQAAPLVRTVSSVMSDVSKPSPACSSIRRRAVDVEQDLVTQPECGARRIDRTRVGPQPFPTTVPLGDRLDWSLERLIGELAYGPPRPVYPYVVASVERRPDGRFAQYGTSPNFQGGVVTLCACKHHMRSGSRFRDQDGVWVAGVTGAGIGGRGRRHLFYLMLVAARADSPAEMWDRLASEVREAKSASRHPLGDLYEPRCAGLTGDDRYDVTNYRAPLANHDHAAGSPPYWHADIDVRYGQRRPVLLAGDPHRSWLWSRPMIRLRESSSRRLPRTPATSDSLSGFLDRLQPESRD